MKDANKTGSEFWGSKMRRICAFLCRSVSKHSFCFRIFIGAEAAGEKVSYLIYVDYNNLQSFSTVLTLPETQIQSIHAINKTFVLVGSLEGVLYGIDIKKPDDISVLMKFPTDAILCITGVCVPDLGDWIFLGLASGKVVCLSEDELIQGTDLSSSVIQVADASQDTAENPICNIISRRSLLWLSCGTQLRLYEMNVPTTSGEDSFTLKPRLTDFKCINKLKLFLSHAM